MKKFKAFTWLLPVLLLLIIPSIALAGPSFGRAGVSLSGDLTLTGITVNGNTTLGNLVTNQLTVTGDVAVNTTDLVIDETANTLATACNTTVSGTLTASGTAVNLQSADINIGDGVTDDIDFIGDVAVNTNDLVIDETANTLTSACGVTFTGAFEAAAAFTASGPSVDITSADINIGDTVTDDIDFIGDFNVNTADLAIDETAQTGASDLTWTFSGATQTFQGDVAIGNAVTDVHTLTGDITMNTSDFVLDETADTLDSHCDTTISGIVTASGTAVNLNSADINIGDGVTDDIDFIGDVAVNTNDLVIDETANTLTSACAVTLTGNTEVSGTFTASGTDTDIHSANIDIGNDVTDDIDFIGDFAINTGDLAIDETAQTAATDLAWTYTGSINATGATLTGFVKTGFLSFFLPAALSATGGPGGAGVYIDGFDPLVAQTMTITRIMAHSLVATVGDTTIDFSNDGGVSADTLTITGTTSVGVLSAFTNFDVVAAADTIDITVTAVGGTPAANVNVVIEYEMPVY